MMGLSDLELLRTLFTDTGPYRHQMGLRRMAAEEFYAPTAEGPAIMAERRKILAREREKRTVDTPEGRVAAAEFAPLIGVTNLEELEPDLLIVAPPDWTLIWANVCFPSRWSLEGKTRKPLHFIHAPVPGLNEKLGSKIAAFFARLNPAEGWRRANWGMSTSAARDQHPDIPIPRLTEETPIESVFVRIEDQHLLKVPVNGAIVFGIRIVSVPWTDVAREPELAAVIREKLRTMDPAVARYKAIPPRRNTW